MKKAIFLTALLALTATAAQAQDRTTTRTAYNTCMHAFAVHAATTRMDPGAFNTAFGQQCTTQEAAYRAAIIADERGAGATQQQAEQTATDEIAEARANFRGLYENAH